MTAINIATLGRLAAAPAAPDKVTISGALSRDTQVEWAAVPGAVRYRVHWRRNDTAQWSESRDVTETKTVLTQVPVDDHFVGVSAVAADGAESLVTFGGR
ncbi:hypothetical protein GCM10020258_01990 [Sphingomonas yabuuchiae]